MKRYPVALSTALVLACGCAPISTTSSLAPATNLAKYHTYAFYTSPTKQGKPQTVADQDIEAALRQDLQAKGFREAAPGQRPDFFVAHHLREKLDVAYYGYGWDWGWGGAPGGPDVSTYTEGTLIVDFIDPASNKAFWRGTASEVIDHPDAPNAAKIDEAVAKLVQGCPTTVAATPRSTM